MLDQHHIALHIDPPTEAEYNEIVANMKADGYWPDKHIVLYESKVLDGWTRYRASLDAGVKAEFKPYTGNMPYHYVRMQNCDRRHLTTIQRTIIKARLLPGLAAEAQSNAMIPAAKVAEAAVKSIAEEEGVSEATVKNVLKVEEKGTPELKKAVFDGTVGAREAARIADKPAAEQRREVRGKGDAFEEEDDKGVRDGPRDKDGYPIPKKLRDYFNSWFTDKTKEVKIIKRQISTSLGWNPWLRQKETIQLCGALISELLRANADFVHQECDGKGCKVCMQVGFLPEWKRDALLQEARG
jgi:hypothetical protein